MHPEFERRAVRMEPLSQRRNKVHIERDHVSVDQTPGPLNAAAAETVSLAATRIRAARAADRSVIMAFGAHTIKNGLAPVLIALIEEGWVSHLATNGAGIIHDWEFAYLGESSEDVRENIAAGRFGNWQETGFYINLALVVGAYEGRGYGEAVGSLIHNEGVELPAEAELLAQIRETAATAPAQAAAAADLLRRKQDFELPSGQRRVEHRWRRFSIQAAAFRLGVPFTGHPMFGHDIIYNHPMNSGAAIGRAAERDFLRFAASVSALQDGVYLSIGSAVMSPMIFEKSLSMVQNVRLQDGARMAGYTIVVVDLAATTWDWSRGEPPADNPAYYLRYNKTFSRMGGELHSVTADNRDFLLALYQELHES